MDIGQAALENMQGREWPSGCGENRELKMSEHGLFWDFEVSGGYLKKFQRYGIIWWYITIFFCMKLCANKLCYKLFTDSRVQLP